MSRSGNSVIQGFFAQGVAQLAARFGPRAAAQPKCTSPNCAPRPSPLAVKPTRPIQPHAAGNGSAFPLSDHLASFTQVGGQPLPAAVRQKMESFFGASFGDVRVHVGPHASAIGALAFTQGTHIHFAPGQYNPSSPQGQQLLGHELTHVVQQRAGRVRNPFGSGVAVVQDVALEAEADRLGRRAAAQVPPIQRQVAPPPPQPIRAAVQRSVAPPVRPQPVHATVRPRIAAPPPPRPQPARATVQRYTVVGNDKIYLQEPASRPWFGYPYAVVPKASRFSAQQRAGGGAGVNEFLVPGRPDDAHVRHAALDTLALRVSDDANLAIESSDLNNRQPKTFFATAAVIAAANIDLAAANSSVTLHTQNEKIKILTGWSTQTTLFRVRPAFSQNPAQNCDELAGRITGIGDGFRTQTRAGVVGDILESFLDGDPRTFDHNAEAAEYVRWKSLRPGRLRRLGANAGATPEVGEAFTIATVGVPVSHLHNATQVVDIASGVTRNLNWAFHFAGVVARSGGDRITLENYARGDNRKAGADPRWYFQMYGESPGQTFHEFHEARQEYANPITVAVSRNPRTIPRSGPLTYPAPRIF